MDTSTAAAAPLPARRQPALIKGLGLSTTTALVAGNMIGSGIYVIPGLLAQVAGPISLVAWVGVAAGYLCLTAVYADLARAYPISGGMQVYAQRALGDGAGLAVAFLYWVSCIIGNAAFLTAFVGYLQVFVPQLHSPALAFWTAQALLWTLTAVNAAGVRASGQLQLAATVLKTVPLLVLAVALLARGSSANLHPLAPHGGQALLPAVSLIAWLFVGAESVTVPAEEVRGSGVTLQRAAYSGYALASIVYLLVAVALALGLPNATIAGSASPLAHAAELVLGNWGRVLLTVGALVSIAGVLNGWLLVVGRLPYAAAHQGLAPALLGRLHARTATPIPSLLMSSCLSAGLVLLYFTRSLLDTYNFVVLAATATALVAIGLTCVAQLVLMRREPRHFTASALRRGRWTAAGGLAIVTLMIAGSGGQVLGWTLVLGVLPLPWYLWLRRRGARRRA